MQNNHMTTVRGYAPQQTTGSMAPVPPYQQPMVPQVQSPLDRLKTLWAQLDPIAVALLAGAVLGLAYALFATLSFWWFNRVLVHLIMAWAAVIVNAVATMTGKRELMLATAAVYALALLLFVNYFYLMLPQPIICLWAWYKTRMSER